MRIAWTRRYLEELTAIADYIGERNPQAAARVVNEIHRKTERLLSANPFIGRIGDDQGDAGAGYSGDALYRRLSRTRVSC